MIRVKSVGFAAVVLLLLVTNIITAEVVSNHKSKPTATPSTTNNHTYKTTAELVKNSLKETGHEVTVTGTIVKADTTYYVVGQGKPPIAIKLDFSQSSLDPSRYLSATPTTGKPAPVQQYSVTGILSTADKNSFLAVKSVKGVN